MKQLINFINALYVRFRLTAKDQKGQGLVEYALILVLIAIVVFAALKGVGTTTDNTFKDVDTKLKNTAAP